MPGLTHILETCLYSSNLGEAEAFYTMLLEREPYQKQKDRFVFYKLEAAMLLLFNPEATAGDNQGLPSHGTQGAGHACFRIDRNQFEGWKSRLAELGISVELEHTWPNGSKSLYFRDPAGNSLELTSWETWSRYG